MEKNQTMQQKAPRSFCLRSFRVTRAFWVLLFCGLCMTAMPVNAQDSKVTLHVKDMPLGDVVKELRKQTGKDFLFSNREVDANQKVTVDVTAKLLKEVLPLVFGKNYRFEIEENVVVVRPSVQTTASGQKGLLVSGVVLDEKQQPLPGVTVKLMGTTVGTATAQNGKFALHLPITKGTLEFSFVGFKPQQIAFTESMRDSIRVILKEDVAGLDEVQVIAYGQQKKRTVISSISSIKADDIKELPTHSFESLLQGHMAGVEVNNISGAPGGGGSIVAIRGYNSFFVKDAHGKDAEGADRAYGTPLYVVDGVPMQAFTSPVTGTNTLSSLDPSMIESIEVLKDAASSAIYGSRAGNGVILITTKKGRSGQAKFMVNASYSASWLPRTPEQSGGQLERWYHLQGLRNTRTPYQAADGTWRMPSSFGEVYNFAAKNESNQPYYDWFYGTQKGANTSFVLQDSLNSFYNNSTDWWRYSYHTANVYNVNIQASGGGDKVTYMIGAGYFKEEGIMYGSDFERLNVMTNISAHPTKRLTVDNQIALGYSNRSKGGAKGGAKIEGMTVDPMKTSSLLPSNGNVVEELLGRANSVEQKNHDYSARYNMVLNYEIIKNLSLRITGGIDYSQQNMNQFEPSTNDERHHWSKSEGAISRNIALQNENLLNYSLTLKQNHNFSVLLGLSFLKNQYYTNSGRAQKGPNDYTHYVQGTWGNQQGLVDDADAGSKTQEWISAFNYSSDFEEEHLNSYFGRLTYNYKEKYMFEATVRRDGSSVFGEKVRWATFPSFAIGWIFSDESFVKPLYWLSIGKIRASWGRSGQKFNQRYLAHGLMGGSQNTFYGNVGIVPDQNGGVINRKLTWEETDQYDVGLDMSFLNYRLKFTLDYYYRRTKGQLNNVKLPGDIYFHTFQWQNALATSNQGIELELTADIFRETAVKWRMKFNVSRNWNRLDKTIDGYDFENNVLGKPLYRIRVFKTDGFYNAADEVPVYYIDKEGGMPKPLNTNGGYGIFFQGTRKILDLNSDGTIDEDDRYYAETPLPLAHGGFSNEIRWKQLDLNVFFVYSLGRHIVNQAKYQRASVSYGDEAPLLNDVRKYDMWNGNGRSNYDFPGYQYYSSLAFQFDGGFDKNIESVNFIRLKQLTLGYNLHDRIAKKIGLSGVRVFLTMENLFLITNYSGLDPETVDITSGIDMLQTYPLPRKFTIGLTVNF